MKGEEYETARHLCWDVRVSFDDPPETAEQTDRLGRVQNGHCKEGQVDRIHKTVDGGVTRNGRVGSAKQGLRRKCREEHPVVV